MKSRILMILLVALLATVVYPAPQRRAADSLSRLLRSVKKEDTAKVSLLLAYAKSLLAVAPDSAGLIGNQAAELSKKLAYPYGIIRGINTEAISNWYRNNSSKAIPLFEKSLQLARDHGISDLESMVANNLGVYYGRLGYPDSALKYNQIAREAAVAAKDRGKYIKATADMGMVYYNKGKYIEAIDYTMEAKKYYDSCQQLYELEICYMRIGLIYSSINDFRKSIGNYRKALEVNKLVRDEKMEMMIFQNIGLMYVELEKRIDSASFYLLKSLEMARKMNAQETILAALTNLGNISLETKKYDKAIVTFEEVLKLPLIPQRNQERASVWVNLGKAYLGLNRLKEAEEYVLKGLTLAKEHQFIRIEFTASKIIADIAAKKGNYQSAYLYYRRYAELHDTLGNLDTKRKIDEIIFENTLNTKERENLLLQNENKNKLQTIKYQQFIIGAVVLVLLLGSVLLVVIVRNNRRQKRMNNVLDQKNRELSELNTMKDKFFSIIAHDLKSPFNGLLGLLTELDENYDDLDESSRHRIIGSLKRSSHNTFNLLVNLLDWARSQQGQLQSHPAVVSLDEIVREVIVILLARASVKQQQLISEVTPETKVYADPQILRGMLLNLVNNGIKFTPARGSVVVRAYRLDHQIRVEVADTGIGIPPEEVEKLFRIDMQFKRRGTENEPGTGLGLVMCREFANLLGGEIGVVPNKESGTVFYFTIPDTPPVVEPDCNR